MKTKLTLFALLLASMCFAQLPLPWNLDGNSVILGTPRFGTTNNKGFNIITNNQPAVNVANDGTFNFIKPVNFTNAVKFDSLRVIHYIDVDSIHCRTIKVGHSWTVNDAGPLYFGTRPFNQQLQNASNNAHVFEGGAFGSPIAARDNVRAVVGYLNSPNGPQHRFVAHSNFNNDVFAAFTNINSYGIPTSYASTDGFKVGILANGIAQLNQQENLPMTFFTGNPVGLSTERMRIVNSTGRVGINNTNPLNRLEITSAAGDPGFASANGSSGLKFSNLNNSNTPIANPSNNVLGVDAAGNVILVPGGTGGPAVVTAQNGLNTSVASPAVELGGLLLHNTAINQANFDMAWYNQGRHIFQDVNTPSSSNSNSPKFYIESNTQPTAFNAMVNVPTGFPGVTGTYGATIENFTQNGFANIAGNFKSIGNAASTGVTAYATTSSNLNNGNNRVFGVVGQAYNGFISQGGNFYAESDPAVTNEIEGAVCTASASGITQVCTGVFGTALGTANIKKGVFGTVPTINANEVGYGVFGIAESGNSSSPSPNFTTLFGVYGQAEYAQDNYGVFGAIKNNGTNGYAVYGDASAFTADPAGIKYAGYFNGDVNVTGALSSVSFNYPSDQNLKTNVTPITNSKQLISQLQPKYFYYDTTKYFLKGHSSKQYGLIAQQVQSVLPELVSSYKVPDKKDSIGNVIASGGTFKNLNYNAFIGILLANAKEQNEKIDSLIAALNSNARVINPAITNNPDAGNPTTLNKQAVTLSNADAIVLDQNQPNPFSESTVIKYNVPETYGYAQLIFTTAEGRILKTIDIAKKGAGEITVYANDLSNGIYTYTLVVDGKTIDSKKMIRQN